MIVFRTGSLIEEFPGNDQPVFADESHGRVVDMVLAPVGDLACRLASAIFALLAPRQLTAT
jgi:hypothetical protein